MNFEKELRKFCDKAGYLNKPALFDSEVLLMFGKYCVKRERKKERKRKLKILKNRILNKSRIEHCIHCGYFQYNRFTVDGRCIKCNEKLF